MPTLIVTPRFTDDAQKLWRAAGQLGWNAERLHSWRVPDHVLTVEEPVLYVEALFGPQIASHFGLTVSEPPDDWLPRLPEEYRKRHIKLMTLREARLLTDRAFFKPPSDKSFPATVCRGSDLPSEFDGAQPVLCAEVVTWESEFRCFVLDRSLRALSIYARHGELQKHNDYSCDAEELGEASVFVKSMLDDPRVILPRAAVLDVGKIAHRGWAVVEQNGAWGSGLYGCDPEQVLHVLRYAAEKRQA